VFRLDACRHASNLRLRPTDGVPTIGAVRSREEFMIRSIVWAIALCVCSAGTARAQDAKTKGEQAFADQKCSLCHSIAGKGNAKGRRRRRGSPR
jgi:mono/diheme cytochrome c family protein